MFTLKDLLRLLQKENRGWKNPTAMTRVILTALTNYMPSSDVASKVFSGVNQGRNIYFDISQEVSDGNINDYLTSVELRLRNQNFRNGNFDNQAMVKATYRLLKESTTLNQDIYQGLLQSYSKHHSSRPYLFLAECFYYALVCRHDKMPVYRTAMISDLKYPQSLSAWGDVFEENSRQAKLSPKCWATINQMTDKEIAVFKRLAKLAIIDEDEQYYLYAPVTDEGIQLYKDYGIGNNEFLLMEEFGLINLGARIDNIIAVKSDLAGFQNDHLILVLTTKATPVDVTYKSYAFTTVGLELLELLEGGTDDIFFEQLSQLFVQQYVGLEIDFYLAPVDVVIGAKSMTELEKYRMT